MEYILHIGLGKTGSSSLQRALFDNRESLRRHGVIYPKTSTGGKFLTKYRHYKLRNLMLRSKDSYISEMRTDWIERLRSETVGAKICVLSDEELSALPDRIYDLEAITSLIPREQTRIVMYVREPVAHAVSRYQQRIKHKLMTKCLRDFAESWYPSDLSAAERWSRVFGKNNVMVRLNRRDYCSWDIVSDFADVIGLKREDAFPSLEGRVQESNPDMAGNLLFVKRNLNRFITFEENRSIREEIEELKFLDGSFRGKIPVDQETVNMIACRSREQFAGLDRNFGLSIIPRDKPIDALPCPDHDRLAHDFARILAWAHDRKGAMAPLLERVSGMFASDGPSPNL